MPRTSLSVLSALLALLTWVATATADSIGDDEKRPLDVVTVKAKARLVHPTLGFSIANPGDGFVAKPSSVASHLPPGMDAYAFTYVKKGGMSALLIVDVFYTPHDKAEYEEMVAGLRHNMFRALVDDRTLHVDHEQLTWRDGAAESQSNASSGPLRFRFDTYVGSFAGKPRTIAVIALTADDSLAKVVASFHR